MESPPDSIPDASDASASSSSFLGSVPNIVWMILAYLVFYLYQLYMNQSRILYIPHIPMFPSRRTSDNPYPYDSPRSRQMEFEDVTLTTADGLNLHAWFVRAPAQSSSVPTIVFFHENAGNIGMRMQNIELLVKSMGFNVFIFDYRGYGNSDEARIDEAGLKIDGDAVATYLASRTDIDQRKIFFFGRSLGGAVATSTASHFPDAIAGLILENTFTSIDDLVDHIYPIVSGLKWLLLKIHWRSVDIIPTLKHRILFISGAKDAVVPPPLMRRLYDAATGAAYRDFFVVEDGDHNDTPLKGGAPYLVKFRDFVTRALLARGLEGLPPAPPTVPAQAFGAQDSASSSAASIASVAGGAATMPAVEERDAVAAAPSEVGGGDENESASEGAQSEGDKLALKKEL